MNAVSIRGDWVGRSIGGKYPLLAWLGGSNSSGVFLTELVNSGHDPGSAEASKAVIRLIPATAKSEDRLAIWNSAIALSHPHLERVLHAGHAEVDEIPVIFVVTEVAEEALAQILPERPLNAKETRDMLASILEALDYLHHKGFVHGCLKPSNILVIENEVKLSSDALLLSGKSTLDGPSADIHNAPELAENSARPSADIWALGVTIVEAMTQESPIWDAASDAEPEVPDSIPRPFAQIVHLCLQVNPAQRCTLEDIRALLEGKPLRAAQSDLHSPHPHRLAQKETPRRIPLIPLIVGLILLIAIIIGLQMHSRRTQTAPLATEATRQAPPTEPSAPPPTTSSTILTRNIPPIPRSASRTIHGTIAVTVLVKVDPSGRTAAELAERGPSAYFARIALESARKWEFKPAQQSGKPVTSTWLLHYAFRRDGVDVSPVESQK